MTELEAIRYRQMPPEELNRIADLDRAEQITTGYEVRAGELVQIEVDWDVPNWDLDGEGEHSVNHQIKFCRTHLAVGGVALGAFDGDSLAGIAVVRPHLPTLLGTDLAQLAYLQTSRAYRRQGIAGKLMDESIELARRGGAKRMYISATPSASAVGFYCSYGAELVDPVDPELFALEPEDIHLILAL